MTLLHQAAQKAVEALPSYFINMDGQMERSWNGAWFHYRDVIAALQQQPEPVATEEAAYQRGKRAGYIDGYRAAHADERQQPDLSPALQHQEVPREPVADFDTWQQNPYTKVLMDSIKNDYMPRADAEALIRAAASPSTTRQQEVGSDIVEAIARQWDGCMAPMFDATGNPTDALDIGATIRADGIPAAAPSPLQREMGSGYEFVGGFLQDKRVDGSTRWNQVSKQYENDADVVKLYRAAAPSPLQQEARNGWRPIATAPKDGREIILREGSRVGAACWVEWLDTHDNDGAPNADGGEGWTIGYDGDEWRNPTAWQPLPAAPSTPEKAGGVSDGVKEGAEPRRWHELKTDPGLFDEVAAGRKTWEIRLDDRDYIVGDGLILWKTLHSGAQMRNGHALIYVGEPLRFVVTHVLTGYGLQDGWCGLSIRPYGVPVLPRGYEVWATDCRPSEAPGAWTCKACGFRGFWRGVHCGPSGVKEVPRG